MSITILAIESSCDDTSIAILRDGQLLSNVLSSQAIHEKYGGVVPEAASRIHMEWIVPLCRQALKKAQLELTAVDAIAVTRGPGLLGSLIVGLSFAKGLKQGLGIPIIEVNHLQAHVLSLLLSDPKPSFPFLCLTVSGGHTQLVFVESALKMEVIGQTLDDAAGEAFDKIGKIMGLPYPAGPQIDAKAKLGIPKYTFPKTKLEDFKFSFSGLKTAVLYFLKAELKKDPLFVEKNLNDICCSVQMAIIDNLVFQLTKAANHFNIKEIGIAGGVSANSGLRQTLQELGEQNDWKVYFPKMAYCTDNAAMIAMVGYYKFMNNEFADDDLTPLARYPI